MKLFHFSRGVLVAGLCCVVLNMAAARADHARPGVVSVIELDFPAPDLLAFLVQNDFNFDRISGGRIRVYADAGEVALLNAQGIPYSLVELQPNPPKLDPNAKGLGVYHGYASMVTELHAYADAHPEITRLVNIGTSVRDRVIYALLITDNPDVQEDEPEFKYIANMHGNEVVGLEMCLYLIDLLLGKYGDADSEGQRITSLVNESEIWIVPTMNPDGNVLGQRNNYYGYDLNRNFPSWVDEGPYGNIFDGDSLGDAGRPKEIQVIMQWSAAHSFTLSANFHEGALVANYPYDENMNGVPDGGYSVCPDDALFIYISEAYSQHNLPMWNNWEFEHGISNGSAWYTIYGGMQDWNYLYLSDNEITLELSNSFRPLESLLPTFWSQNKESMLSYLETGHIGIRGLVTDAYSGAPVHAKIEVAGNEHPVYTDPDVGDYHRMLLPGTYAITVSAPEYIAQTITGIVVAGGTATRMDIQLHSVNEPEGEGMEEGSIEGEGVEEGETEAEGLSEGITEGIFEGEGSEEGVVEGEGVMEGEGIVEGEGAEEGTLEGEDIKEGEDAEEGEGSEEGLIEGEGDTEGEGAEEGSVEGEGLPEGVSEGEGVAEGSVEGEGANEGVSEGEGGEEGVVEGEGPPEGLFEGEGESGIHAADQDGDYRISLSEVLRVIQFFNSGGYHCQPGAEDGFAPGSGDYSCAPHDSDYNAQDWRINLSEVLRVIQFFNSGGYHTCDDGEDGFCPGI